MAVIMTVAPCVPDTFSPATCAVSSKANSRRARPNLTRFCQKTRMCSFFPSGACKKGNACSFAHDESELTGAPDLSCTKLCPKMLKTGICPKGSTCKFAHSAAELRRLDVDDVDECELLPSVPPQRVVHEMSRAADCGSMTVGEMALHLMSIFRAVFAQRPELESAVPLPIEQVALATAEQAWSDAGLSLEARMSFEDVVRWCSRDPALLLAPEDAKQSTVEEEDCAVPTRAPSEDWSTASEVSTDDDCTSGYEVIIKNTFFDVVDTSRVQNAARRSRSLPSQRSFSISE